MYKQEVSSFKPDDFTVAHKVLLRITRIKLASSFRVRGSEFLCNKIMRSNQSWCSAALAEWSIGYHLFVYWLFICYIWLIDFQATLLALTVYDKLGVSTTELNVLLALFIISITPEVTFITYNEFRTKSTGKWGHIIFNCVGMDRGHY